MLQKKRFFFRGENPANVRMSPFFEPVPDAKILFLQVSRSAFFSACYTAVAVGFLCRKLPKSNAVNPGLSAEAWQTDDSRPKNRHEQRSRTEGHECLLSQIR